MKIILSSVEQRLVKHIANLRIENDRKVGAVPTVYNADPMENEINYIGAELAYCKLFNCYPDLGIDEFIPFDAIRRNGETVDIKHTKLNNGRLLVKVKDREYTPAKYALMIGTFPEYYYAGDITSDELLRDENIIRNIQHPAYAATQSRLQKLPIDKQA